jgi:hypothetical protein
MDIDFSVWLGAAEPVSAGAAKAKSALRRAAARPDETPARGGGFA